MAKRKREKAKKAAPRAPPKEAVTPKKPKLDLAVVPKPVDLNRLFIAPPTLPMRHDHGHEPVREVVHPEVRLVIRTRYMEQKPHVLFIESAMFATIATLFAGVIFYLLKMSVALMVPLLLPFWLAIVILSFKFFEE